MIKVKHLSFSYEKFSVLDNISFDIKKGEVVSILGPNGVGKSTLFKCLLGILNGYTGRIMLDNTPISKIPLKELSAKIAYVPQSHYPAFHYRVFDMVLMGTSSQVSLFSTPTKLQNEVTSDALERLSISHLAHRDYMHLSGGEKQLVLIARALAQNAKIILMDEPTANLDYGNQLHVLSCIKDLSEQGYTILLTSHNPEQSYMFSTKIIALLDGRIIVQGSPQTVISSDTIKKLYSVETTVESLYKDCFRICLPKKVLNQQI